jgi:hypothetical protein
LNQFIAIIFGVMVCLVNFLISILVAKLAYRKREQGQFNKVVLLSLGIRLAGLICVTVAGLYILSDFRLEFSLSLIITTFIMTIVEILYFNYRSNSLNLQNHSRKEG